MGIFAESSISSAKFQHIAAVLAEWLGNDEDGCVDNPLVLSKILATSPRTVPVGFKDTNSDNSAFENSGYQPNVAIFDDELLPQCSGPNATDNCADASLEEILHLITSQGYQRAWPDVFSVGNSSKEAPRNSSKLTEAMDVARGGKFLTIPSSYPSNAWYTYNDTTCDYGCMATEYIYWGISAYVGSIAGRKSDIADEWDFATRAELLAGDKLYSAIHQDTSTYRLPTVSPTGFYSAPATCVSGPSHGGSQ